MDISDTLAPTSDQLDAVDLLGGPQTFTVSGVSRGSAEQPVNIDLAEFPRPWRPGKSMRRVLVACWGPDAAAYVGRQVTLWCDPAVRFGGQEVGGVRITHLSGLDKPRRVPLLVSRGKSAMYRVDPLAEDARPSGDAPVTQVQKARLGVVMKRLLIDGPSALLYASDVLERDVASANDLTAAEADRLLAVMESEADAADTARATQDAADIGA